MAEDKEQETDEVKAQRAKNLLDAIKAGEYDGHLTDITMACMGRGMAAAAQEAFSG